MLKIICIKALFFIIVSIQTGTTQIENNLFLIEMLIFIGFLKIIDHLKYSFGV